MRRFLSQVPVSDELALVYVQHIAGQQMTAVLRMIEAHTGWKAREASASHFIKPAAVTVISPQFETRISRQGWILRFSSPWHGCYAPSIDQLANRLAQLYRHNCGAIIFTGMGDDGARGCQAIKEFGGQVWVQDPAECTVPAMPEAVIQRCKSDFIGTVDQLAQRLSAIIHHKEVCSP